MAPRDPPSLLGVGTAAAPPYKTLALKTDQNVWGSEVEGVLSRLEWCSSSLICFESGEELANGTNPEERGNIEEINKPALAGYEDLRSEISENFPVDLPPGAPFSVCW
ncbi:hypothetical protein U1Q18_046510 [Sarracenia purpurea var. burkii]